MKANTKQFTSDEAFPRSKLRLWNVGSLVILWLLFYVASASQWSVEMLPGYTGKLPFNLETGYIGVGDLEEVQSFYYFIESEHDPQNDPLMLWLTGGPGCSALSGLMFEIGPLAFNYTDDDSPSLQLNPYSWTKVANIIFLDEPVGSGFSYSTTSEGYYSSTSLSAHHIYEFLREWLIRHPEFLRNDLYISGDSYSGLPVPIVVELILNGNEMGRTPLMNIKGYVLGNPITNSNSDFNARVKFAHRMSLISDKLYQSAVFYCDGKYANADPNNAQCQKALHAIDDCIFHGLAMAHILEPDCSLASSKPTRLLQNWDPSDDINSDEEIELIRRLKRQRSNRQADHPEMWCRYYNYFPIYDWANDKLVQSALHVRKGSIEEWVRCNRTLSGFTKDINNTVPYHQRLTDKFVRALVYSGDQDMMVPYVGTLEWIKSLQVPVIASWRPWFVDGQVAGYTTKYSNLKYRLTYTTLKGAGHTGPEYKPKEGFSMIDKWLSHYPL